MDHLNVDNAKPTTEDMARKKREPDPVLVEQFVQRLWAAGTIRSEFDLIIDDLTAVRRTHAPELVRIAHLYVFGGRGKAPISGVAALAMIQKRFRERLHEDKGAARHHS